MNEPVIITIGAISLLLLSSCSIFLPPTAAKTPAVKHKVTKMIMALETAEDSHCQQRNVVKTEILRFYVMPGISAERWTVDRCGTLINYRVTLIPHPYGDTDVQVQREQ